MVEDFRTQPGFMFEKLKARRASAKVRAAIEPMYRVARDVMREQADRLECDSYIVGLTAALLENLIMVEANVSGRALLNAVAEAGEALLGTEFSHNVMVNSNGRCADYQYGRECGTLMAVITLGGGPSSESPLMEEVLALRGRFSNALAASQHAFFFRYIQIRYLGQYDDDS